MGGGTPPGSALIVEMTPSRIQSAAAEQDPAERSARAIECAQKADAQGLQGKIRKHFLHKCKAAHERWACAFAAFRGGSAGLRCDQSGGAGTAIPG